MNNLNDLKVGSKYTIVLMSEIGFLTHPQHFILKGVTRLSQYAQYSEAYKLVIRRKRKRSDEAFILHPGKSFLLYEGHVSPKTEIFGEPDSMGCRESLFSSCDPRYFDLAVESIPEKPLINQQPNRQGLSAIIQKAQ